MVRRPRFTDAPESSLSCGWPGPPFRWDEDRRFLLCCELDPAFSHLYLGSKTGWLQQPAALTQAFPAPRAAVSYILDTFPIVKGKDEAKWADYRTKRTVLEIYNPLAESMQTGQRHQTCKLDPIRRHPIRRVAERKDSNLSKDPINCDRYA